MSLQHLVQEDAPFNIRVFLEDLTLECNTTQQAATGYLLRSVDGRGTCEWSAGITGYTGFTGVTGPTGPAGPDSNTGATGPAGMNWSYFDLYPVGGTTTPPANVNVQYNLHSEEGQTQTILLPTGVSASSQDIRIVTSSFTGSTVMQFQNLRSYTGYISARLGDNVTISYITPINSYTMVSFPQSGTGLSGEQSPIPIYGNY